MLPRIIPAYAGSTTCRGSYRAWNRDHPRIRGEHVKNGTFSTGMLGSSPHTRGAHTGALQYAHPPRIIPAYAGSTSGSVPPPVQVADHPRIRGEHGPPMPVNSASNGSSPHTRGARLGRRQPREDVRIIPAYAGSTRTGCGSSWRRRDHPRIRGEHLPSSFSILRESGSSPHTRGALVRLLIYLHL